MSDYPDWLSGDRGSITYTPLMPFKVNDISLSVGEDGDWLALGHVSPEDMLKAVRYVENNELGVYGYDETEYHASDVQQTKAVFTAPTHDPYDWWCYYGRDAIKSEHAIPITLWRV